MDNRDYNSISDNKETTEKSEYREYNKKDIDPKIKKEEPDKKSIKKGPRDYIRTAIMTVCVCVFIGCAVYLGKYYYEINHSQSGVKELRNMIATDENPQDSNTSENAEPAREFSAYTEVNGRRVQKKFANLYEANPDFIGWITIQDTQVDYPVMQYMEDNEFYIHRNFNKEYDGSGLPFLDINCDYQKPTANLLIYGHNMKAGTMFAQIMKYNDQTFYNEHPTIRFDTLDEDDEYEVVAAFYSEIYPADDTTHFKYYKFFDAENEEEFNDYVTNVIRLSAIDTGIVPEYGDELITLSTCAYHTEDGRFALVARKIKKN